MKIIDQATEIRISSNQRRLKARRRLKMRKQTKMKEMHVKTHIQPYILFVFQIFCFRKKLIRAMNADSLIDEKLRDLTVPATWSTSTPGLDISSKLFSRK